MRYENRIKLIGKCHKIARDIIHKFLQTINHNIPYLVHKPQPKLKPAKMTGQDPLVDLHEDILKEIDNMLVSIKALDPILDKLAKFPAEGPNPELKDEYDALVVAQLLSREKVKESE